MATGCAVVLDALSEGALGSTSWIAFRAGIEVASTTAFTVEFCASFAAMLGAALEDESTAASEAAFGEEPAAVLWAALEDGATAASEAALE